MYHKSTLHLWMFNWQSNQVVWVVIQPSSFYVIWLLVNKGIKGKNFFHNIRIIAFQPT